MGVMRLLWSPQICPRDRKTMLMNPVMTLAKGTRNVRQGSELVGVRIELAVSFETQTQVDI